MSICNQTQRLMYAYLDTKLLGDILAFFRGVRVSEISFSDSLCHQINFRILNLHTVMVFKSILIRKAHFLTNHKMKEK
jgi:hypothetical protein